MLTTYYVQKKGLFLFCGKILIALTFDQFILGACLSFHTSYWTLNHKDYISFTFRVIHLVASPHIRQLMHNPDVTQDQPSLALQPSSVSCSCSKRCV